VFGILVGVLSLPAFRSGAAGGRPLRFRLLTTKIRVRPPKPAALPDAVRRRYDGRKEISLKPASLSITTLEASHYEVQRWKNGQGETREIARDPGEPFAWRLSSALVSQSGPFSNFPGYDRSLTVLSGGPMALSHDGKPPRTLATHSPYQFRGEAATTAALSAPCEDFNLFTLREKMKGSVYPARFARNEELQFSLQRQEHFLFCLEGAIEVLDPNSTRTFPLVARDTLRFSRASGAECLNLRATTRLPSALCLWIVLFAV
jgi:uncharacterized protein